MIPTKFTFEFANDDDTAHLYAFDVVPVDDATRQLAEAIHNAEYDPLFQFTSDIETRYGVHDVGFSPPEEFYGFNTYEVEPADQPKLITEWQDYFRGLGFQVSDPVMTVHQVEAL